MTNRDMSGILFRNEEKRGENSPDYGGTCMVNGIEYRVSGWRKDGKKGPFVSLAFRPMREEQKPQSKPTETPVDDDSRIPF